MLPRGVGSYVRGFEDSMPELVRADFVLIPFNSSDSMIARYKERFPDKPIYLFGLPSAFRPETYRTTLRTASQKVREHGLRGIVVNPEAGWQVSREVKENFAKALKSLSNEMDIGIVSTPFWPGLTHDNKSLYADSNIWGAVEIYGVSSQDPSVYRSWFRRWYDAFRGRVGITFNAGGTIDGTIRQSTASYLKYLNDLPVAPFGIAWGTTGDTYAVIRQVITDNLDLLPGRKGAVQSSLMTFFASSDLIIGFAIAAIIILIAGFVLPLVL